MEQDDFDAIVHARASALHALLQFQGPAGTSLHSERNPAHMNKLTFDCREAEPKGGWAPDVIGHFDGHLRLLC